MQFSTSPKSCGCHPKTGLGFLQFAAPLAAAYLSSKAGGSGGGGDPSAGMMPPSTEVNTTVSPNIKVSPQISPIFQQQFQPTNSPINAGTSQSSAPEGYGGAPIGLPNNTIPMPNSPGIPMDWTKLAIYGGIGLAVLFGFKMLSKRRAPSRKRRVSASRKRAPIRRR